jgi:hypothetical protein
MSHEIRQFDVQEGRTMAWHGLTRINALLTLANCWLAGWDYVIERCQVGGKNTPFSCLTVSDVTEEYIDEETGEKYEKLYVGKSFDPGSFKPITNKKLIELLAKATEGKDLTLESCGTIMNRGRQFFSFAMGESYKAAGREFVPFFNIGNGNDRSSPLWQNVSNTCTVCNNTFTANMLTSGLIMEVKKTKFSELKIQDFGIAAKAMLAGQKDFAAGLESMAKAKCTEDTAREFLAGFLGDNGKALSTRAQNTIDEIVVLFKTGAGNDGDGMDDLFQALTDYYTHASAGGEDKWKQFVSSEFGAGRNEKQRAWAMLSEKKLRDGLITLGRNALKETNKANAVTT